MNKNLTSILMALILLTTVVSQAHALEITIDQNGSIRFYADQVLGDSTDEEKRTEYYKKVQERVAAQKTTERATGEEKKMQMEKRTDAPVKTIYPTKDSKIRIKNEADETQVMVGKKRSDEKTEDREKPEFETQQTTKDARVKLEFPAQLKESSAAAKGRRDDDLEDRTNEERGSIGQENRDAIEAKMKQVTEDRQERKNEKVELRTEENANGQKEFVFESRLMKAKAHGAEFSVDPKTNVVTITTPSGNEHVLTHLPDQAVLRMKAAGIIDTASLESGESELELETKPDGSVVYSTTTKKPKKIFGIFRRDVETKVELNDDSGEVVEEAVPQTSLIGRVLDSLAQ